MMNFRGAPGFQKDFKKLSKKFKTLNGDLAEFKKVLSELPVGIGKHFNILTETDYIYIIKARFFCRYLRGKTLRIVYAYHKEKQTIEFIELYFKGNKENEDKGRIKEYLNLLG